MSWYARVKDGIVNQVTYLVDTKDGDWLYREHGGQWLRCAEDGSLRMNFPAIGYTYDPQRDAFIPPKPYPSWILNEYTCLWDAPVPMPQDGKIYNWDEATTSWVEVSP
jgi:hypothetical protein